MTGQPSRLLHFTVLLTILFLAIGCSLKEAGIDEEEESRESLRAILNGWETGSENFRMVGSLVRTTDLSKPNKFTLCTGTLIGKHTVLTAAHCVMEGGKEVPASQLFFTNRDNVLEVHPSQFREVTSVRRHAGHDPNASQIMGPDLAIVRLKANLLSLASLPDVAAGTEARQLFAVGYGQNGDLVAGDLPGVLFDVGAGIRRFGKLAIREVAEAVALDGTKTAAGILKASAYHDRIDHPVYQQACRGDSGGPLLGLINNKTTVVGVLSQGDPVQHCYQNRNSYFVATYPFVSWIKEKKSELEAPGACRAVDDANFVTGYGGCRNVRAELTFSRESDDKLKFEEAKAFCDNLRQGGKSDWRLPSIGELQSAAPLAMDYLALNSTGAGYQFWTNSFPHRVNLGPSSSNGNITSAAGYLKRNVICVHR